MKIISIVIPVYQNAGSLKLTHEQIKDQLQTKYSEEFLPEFIFVNDGSTDNSLNELLEIKETDSSIKIINLSRNFGQANALRAGYNASKGEIILTISADLQDPIDLVFNMIENYKNGHDVIICHRIEREDDFISKLSSRIAYKIIKLTISQMPIGGFDFILLSRRALETFMSYQSKSAFIQADILWAGYPTSLIPYTRQKRKFGKSQYNFWKKFKVFLDGFLDVSYLPIRIVSSIGILFSFLGILFSASVVVAWLFNKTPFSGYAPIIISIFLVGGVNIILLGIIGEYIWRIYDKVQNKPPYVIDRIID